MGTLIEDLKAVEPGYSGITNWSVLGQVDDVEEVSNEFAGDSRWEVFREAVFRRGDEYVALLYSEPATEAQEGQDQSTAKFYEVRPTEVTVIKYVTV